MLSGNNKPKNKKQTNFNNNQQTVLKLPDFVDPPIEKEKKDNSKLKQISQIKALENLSEDDQKLDYSHPETLKKNGNAKKKPDVKTHISTKSSLSDNILEKKPKKKDDFKHVQYFEKEKAAGKKTNDKEKISISQKKQKAGSEFKHQVYNLNTSTYSEPASALSSELLSISDNSFKNPNYYTEDKVKEILQYLEVITIAFKNNPFYNFASAVSLACSKHESYFIRNTTQELLKLLKTTSSLFGSETVFSKTFEHNLSAIKNVNNLISSLLPELYREKQTFTDFDASITASKITSSAEKAILENIRNTRKLQYEIDSLKSFLMMGHHYISLTFFFSQDLINLVNAVMSDIYSTPIYIDANNYNTIENVFDINKIIALRPDISRKITELCGLKWSITNSVNASRPTTKFLHDYTIANYNEKKLNLTFLLRNTDTSNILDDGVQNIVLSATMNIQELFPFIIPSEPSLPTESSVVSLPSSLPTSPLSTVLGLSQMASGKKRSQISQTLGRQKSSGRYYVVPKRFRI